MPLIPGFYLRPEITPYIILFIERDGSTYLTSLLMSHPDIEAIYERLAVLRQKGAGASEQLGWARNFLTPPWLGRKAAVGFKTKLVDVLDREGFTRLLLEKRPHLLYMQRRNRVKAVVSRINARRLHDASGNWNLYKEADRMPPMAIDRLEFDAYLKEREAAEQELETYVQHLQLPTLKTVYEDLMLNREAVLENVFKFLRVAPRPLVSKTLKHTSDNLREVVLNFDELRASYAGTEYVAMFDEVLATT